MDTPHHGRWFEELPVGLVVPHALTRTITETDNVLFTTMTLNPARLHLDADYAAGTEFGRPLVNSLFTLGLLVGISVLETTHGTTVANLGFDEVTFPAPMFAGDTLHGESEVVAARAVEVASRPGHRHLRAPRLQPARRARVPSPPQCAHAPSSRRRQSVNPSPERIRSLLFAPASKPDVLRKLPRSTPDAVALDLEDAVPPDGKPAAREHAREVGAELVADAPRHRGVRAGQPGADRVVRRRRAQRACTRRSPA